MAKQAVVLTTWRLKLTHILSCVEDVCLVEFMHLVCTRMPMTSVRIRRRIISRHTPKVDMQRPEWQRRHTRSDSASVSSRMRRKTAARAKYQPGPAELPFLERVKENAKSNKTRTRHRCEPVWPSGKALGW